MPERFSGSAPSAAHAADSDSDVVDLVALNTALGLDIDERTARSRWLGDRMDYNQAIDWLYFTKYGRL